MYTIIVHISNSEPVKMEVDELPKPTDNVIIGNNPRERNDKELTWLEEGVTQVIFPWWRINFIQILPDEEAGEEFPTFFRED